MKTATIILVALTGLVASALAKEEGRPCGARIAPCPRPLVCHYTSLPCRVQEAAGLLPSGGGRCVGTCGLPTPRPRPATRIVIAEPPEPTTPPPASETRRYPTCGDFGQTPLPCPEGTICVDDPRPGECGSRTESCHKPRVCVDRTIRCRGVFGRRCPEGMICIDDPTDKCVTGKTGIDCIGVCV